MAMTENDKIAKYGVVVCHVQSRTDPGEEPYKIRLKDGIHHCNCKGWIFSKEVPKSCKHIKAYLAEKGKTQKVAEVTEQEIVEKCLRTAGCYDPIKDSCADSRALHHKLARLAQALLPYFGGNGPVEATSSRPMVEEIRTIYLD
ncbi:MAG: hypothetical protein WC919_05270 [Candidatus Paceibacterota bacterium]|jgi:hypothetical protein